MFIVLVEIVFSWKKYYLKNEKVHLQLICIHQDDYKHPSLKFSLLCSKKERLIISSVKITEKIGFFFQYEWNYIDFYKQVTCNKFFY